MLVIGGGSLGGEVGFTARQLGRKVTLIDSSPYPMHGTLGEAEALGGIGFGCDADGGFFAESYSASSPPSAFARFGTPTRSGSAVFPEYGFTIVSPCAG